MLPAANSFQVQKLPRFIENLNGMARGHGMTVEMIVEPYTDNPRVRLWSKWRGTREQLLTLAKPVPSYHLPLSCGNLYIPGASRSHALTALLSGQVTVNGGNVLFEIDWGSPEFTVANLGGVEVISYADEVLYHGPPAALFALGIEKARLPMGKRATKIGRDLWGAEENWSSRRQPDGSILYRVESPAGLRRRRETQRAMSFPTQDPIPAARPRRSSHLRLVVDNTA
jgi:hypothetical protein